MDDPDHDRLNALEKRVAKLISLAAIGVGFGAAALVLQTATKDWGLSHTVSGILAVVAFFAAFLWLAVDFERPEK